MPCFRVCPVISPGEMCRCHQNGYNGCFLNAMCRGSRKSMSQPWACQWNRQAADCAFLLYHRGMNGRDSFLKKRIRRLSAIRKLRSHPIPAILAGKILSASFLTSFLLMSSSIQASVSMRISRWISFHSRRGFSAITACLCVASAVLDAPHLYIFLENQNSFAPWFSPFGESMA